MNATPAAAQTTVWSATLTVGDGVTYRGYAVITNVGQISDADFEYGGVTYTIERFSLDNSGSALRVGLNQAVPAALKSALGVQTGSLFLPLADATLTSNDTQLNWSNTGLSWSVGDTVSLSLGTAPEVSLSATPNPVAEGSPVTVTATLSAALTNAVTIPVTLTAGTAESDDYGTLTSISISSGQTSGTGTITTAQDTDTEGYERFTVSLGTLPSGVIAGTSSSVVIRIRDDDVSYPPPALRELSLFASDKGRFASRGNYVDLEPTFHEDTLNYTVRVDDWAGYIRVGAEARDSNPEDPTKVFINGELKGPSPSRPQDPDPSASSSIWVELKDVTPIEIVVRNPLGESRTYTVRVLRGNAEVSPAQTPPAQTPPAQTPPAQTPTTGGGGPAQSSDASLDTLEVGEDSLDLDPDTHTYTVNAYGETSLTLTPTASDRGARITVNGNTVRSGRPHIVTLEDDGETTIEIAVTAEDGTTRRTYTLTVMSCHAEERKILEMFYHSTQGDMWEQSGGWNTEDDLRDWHGVRTDENGRVISLNLEGNGLSGHIPSALLCFDELSGLLELALWDNEDLSGEEVPEELALAVERAVLRDVAQALELNTEWFDDYEEPFSFTDWHEGVTTDEEGRVTELDFTEEDIEGVIPGSVFELKRLMVIKTGCEVTLEAPEPEGVSVMMAEGCEEIPDETPDETPDDTPTSGGGGCALGQGDSSVSTFGLLLVTLLVFAALVRRRARSN